jgi:hypothetical protein
LTSRSASNAVHPRRRFAADCLAPPQRPAWRVLLCSVLALLLLPGASVLAAKQKAPTTKTVSGMVMDKATNGMGGAEVTLKDKETGTSTAIYAGSNGAYKFSDLDPHHDYEIQAKFQGMTSETRQINSFDTRLKLVINLTLAPPGS